MQAAGIKGNVLNLIKYIYGKTQCAIKRNNEITDFFKYSKGVRQGCPLSPVLFNLYINGIFDLINNNSTSDVYLKENNKVNALMYADDLVLISRTKEGLQHQIDKLSDFCQKWKLTIYCIVLCCYPTPGMGGEPMVSEVCKRRGRTTHHR